MISATVRTSLVMGILLAGCTGESSEKTALGPQTAPSASATQAEAPPRSSTKPQEEHACNLLEARDFESVGLTQGRAKPDKTITGTECTWDPVLGTGGFLHLQTLSVDHFGKRKERAIKADAKSSESQGGQMIALSGIGDEAFVQKWKPNETITVRVGDRAFHISGNARLKQEQLEPLARAVVVRL